MARRVGSYGASKKLGRPAEMVVDWGHYQVDLAPAPAGHGSGATTAPVSGRPAQTLASPGTRLAAVFLDFVASLAVALGASALVQVLPVTAAARPYLLGAGITAVLAFVLCQVLLLSRRGQSLGKLALGVRIVRAGDGSNPGFWRAVVLRGVVPSLIAGIPILGQLFTLIDLLCIFGDERRCLHDFLADTKVVAV